jgi:hypothetical protein
VQLPVRFRSARSPADAGTLLALEVDAAEQQRLQRIAERWRAYYGDHPRAVPEPLAGEPDDNLTLNYARLVVDKGVGFLFGQDLAIGLEQAAGDAGPTDELERAIDALWTVNGGMLTLQKAATNGAVAGQAWAKLQPASPDAPAGTPPRIIALDPATVSVRWSPDDFEDVWEYRITWNATDADGSAIVRRQRHLWDGGARTWLIRDEQARGSSSGWEQIAETAWPFPWPAIVGCQNLPAPNEYLGQSDLEPDVLELVYALSRTASDIRRILRLYAHPTYVAFGIGAGAPLRIGGDEVIRVPGDRSQAAVQVLEMQSDLRSSVDYYNLLRQGLHELTRVPEVATGRLVGIGDLSGTALSILYGPLVEKTESKRRLYGPWIQTLTVRALELMRGVRIAPERIALGWPEVTPQDAMQERQALLIDRQLGLSQETALERLGYSPEQEAERRAQDAEAAGALLDAGAAGVGNLPPAGGAATGG